MEKLYLGVAREIITPAIGGQLYGYRPDIFSESVEDDLTVTAYYFKQGDTQALMISATVCELNGELCEDVLAQVEERLGIPKQHAMICATHTHSGPNTSGFEGWGDIDREYCDTVFVPALLKVTEAAIANMQAVKLGVATGDSLVGINRRELTENNEIDFGQNPWGCFNPQMVVLSFANEQGDVVANMVHYGCHGTAAGANHEITRDWSGLMIDTLERRSGGITAFFNGPEGDVGPRISNKLTVGDIRYVRELGAVAAQDAVKIFDKIFSYTDVPLAVSHKTLHVPLKPRMSLEEAQKQLELFKNETVNIGGKIRDHLESIIASYETDYEEQETLGVAQTVIALGDVVFASSPYELFSEIGMRIDAAFKNKLVLSLSNTNDFGGYFVTQDALCRGGYEVDVFLHEHIQEFCDDADFHLIQETVAHVKSLIGE